MKNKMNIRARSGFTLVEIAIVVLLIALLALLAAPAFSKVRDNAQRTRCLDNLRQLNSAVQQYILENNSTTVPELAQVNEYFQTYELPACPAGGTYSKPVATDDVPTCSLGAAKNHVLQE